MASKKLSKAAVERAVADALAGQAYNLSDAACPGLELRVAPRGAVFSMRTSYKKKEIRLRLAGVDLLTLDQARAIVSDGMLMLREKRLLPDAGWVRHKLVELGVVAKAEEQVSIPRRSLTWTFGQAVDEYLDHVKRTLRPATHADRRGMLKIKELYMLRDRPAGSVTLVEMAMIVADIHASGRERYAGKLAECVRPMWTWLALPAQQMYSGVLGAPMQQLRAPDDTNVEAVTGHDDEDDEGTYLPSPDELGRMLALMRADVVHRTMADASLLLLFTAQRRRTVVNARAAQFVDEDGVLVWRIPGRFRKTGRTKKGQPKPRSHDLPLPDEAAAMVRRRLETKAESGWLFPGIRPRRAGDKVGHLGADSLTHVFADLPGITMSPHDTRRGFTTYLEDLIGLDQEVLKVVLDHSEGKSSKDVTDVHYSKARRLKLKTMILTAWSSFLNEHAAKTVLEETAVIKKAITASRNHRARLSAKNPRPKRVRPPRKKQAA